MGSSSHAFGDYGSHNNSAMDYTALMQQVLVGTRPNSPSLVHQARFAIAEIDSELALQLAFLPTLLPISAHQESPFCQERVKEEEAELRAQAEKAKQPHKAIISLWELHQFYKTMLDKEEQMTRDYSQQEPTVGHPLELLGNFSKQHTDNLCRSILDNQSDEDLVMLLQHASFHHAKMLDLSNHLIHKLPSSFGSINLSNLLSLNLSKNQLKELPCAIGDLCNLEVLDLQSNLLMKLPDGIGNLTSLTSLNISGNMVKALPNNIGGCKALKELNVGFNQLEYVPLRIGHELGYLENLSLHSNKLTFLPPSICHLRHLKLLDLHFNKLEALPLAIGNLRALEKLNLSNNFSEFGGELPYSLGDLDNLVELDLSSNQVRVLPDSIGALTKIKVLKLDNNPLAIPPIEVVEHSMEAVLEYMSQRWEAFQDYEEEIPHTWSTSNQLKRSSSSCVKKSRSWLARLLGQHTCSSMPRIPSKTNTRAVAWPNRSASMHDHL